MALYPKAVLRLLPENATQPRMVATQVILHTAVDAPGPTSLYGYFARGDITLESHFFVRNDGTVEQYIDTSRTADANYRANGRAVSIETEDDGNPTQNPWTPRQLASIVALLDWLCSVHPIDRRQCPSPERSGIGWHSMWGAPSEWTPVKGKTCPGAARIPQCPGVIAAVAAGGGPFVPAPKETFMAGLTDAQQKDLYERVKRLTPLPAERITREGEVVKLGTPGSFVADPLVRWVIETTRNSRLLSKVEQTVQAAVAKAIASDGPVDPTAVAKAVVAEIKAAL